MKSFRSFIKLYLKTIFQSLKKMFIGDMSSVAKTIDIKYALQKKDSSFQFKDYETKPNNYQTWLDFIFLKFNLPDLLTAIILSIIVYLIGLFFSFFANFYVNYTNTLAVYLMCFGISLSIYTLRISSKNIHKCFARLRPCFMISDNEYYYFLNTWFKRLSNNKIILFLTLFTTVFLGLLLYYKLYDENIYNKLNLLSLELRSFKDNGWYDQSYLKVKFGLFAFFIIVISSILVTSFRILFVNFFFLLDLIKLPIIPIPNLIRLRLGDISKLYSFTSFNWFIGVSLFGIMLFSTWDWLSISVLSAISLIGFITFITPQYIYSKLLGNSQNLATNWIFSSFYERMNISLNEKNLANIINSNNASKLYKLKSLTDYFDASKPVKLNIYNFPQLILFLLGQIISLSSPKIIEVIKILV